MQAWRKKTLIGIRCQGYSADVQRCAAMLSEIFPEHPVAFISDQRTQTFDFPSGCDVITMTAASLDSLGLFHQREKVGWVCGDYCYYAALSRRWDRLWLIEPDVFVSSAAYAVMRTADTSKADLVGTRIGDRAPSWPWTSRLRAVVPDADPRGVFFPLTRVSRKLAQSCLRFRTAMTRSLTDDPDLRVPNDESVVGTTCISGGFSYVDLTAEHPEVFRHWAWNERFLRTAAESSGEALICHPAYTEDEFAARVANEVAQAVRKTPAAKSLSHLSTEQRREIFAQAAEIL